MPNNFYLKIAFKMYNKYILLQAYPPINVHKRIAPITIGYFRTGLKTFVMFHIKY